MREFKVFDENCGNAYVGSFFAENKREACKAARRKYGIEGMKYINNQPKGYRYAFFAFASKE